MDDYIARQASRHTAVDDKLTSAQARVKLAVNLPVTSVPSSQPHHL
jgi:hypothetical protein